MLFLPHFGFVVFLTITYDNVTSPPRVHCVTRSHCLSNNNINNLQKKYNPSQTSAFLIKSFLTLDYSRNPHCCSWPFLPEGLNCDLRKRWVSSSPPPYTLNLLFRKIVEEKQVARLFSSGFCFVCFTF